MTPNLIPHSQTAADVQLLVMRLRQVPLGETIPYQELSAAIGRDITKRRDILYRACTILEREDKKVFRAVTRKGMKYLYDREIPALAEGTRKTIQRKTKRTLRRLGCINMDNLTQAEVIKTLAYASIAGATLALHHMHTLRQTQAVIQSRETPTRLEVQVIKQLL